MSFIDHCQQFYEQPKGKILFMGINVLFACILFFILIAQARPIWVDTQQKETVTETLIPVGKPISMVKISRNIVQQHLFGSAPQQTPTVVVTNIKVLGLFVANDPKNSSAVLMIDEKPEANYWPGDALPGGGKVVEIQPDRVIIQEHGQRKSILFNMDEFPNTPVTDTRPSHPYPSATSSIRERRIERSRNRRELRENRINRERDANNGNHDTTRPAYSARQWQRYIQRN